MVLFGYFKKMKQLLATILLFSGILISISYRSKWVDFINIDGKGEMGNGKSEFSFFPW